MLNTLLLFANYITTLIHYSCLFFGILLSGYDVCIIRFTVKQLHHYNKTLQLPSLRPAPPPCKNAESGQNQFSIVLLQVQVHPCPSMHRHAHSAKGLSRTLQPIKSSVCALSLLGNHINGLALFPVLRHSYRLLQYE